jgi:transcriptional regulator with XRE-family HTH domain
MQVSKRKPAKFFGKMIRKLREKKGISLRSLAARAELSPTYMSKIERGDVPPPAEDKIRAIASALDQDAFEFLAKAGLVPRELLEVVERHPQDMAVLLRHVRSLNPEQIRQLAMLAHLCKKEDLSLLVQKRADEVAEELSEAKDLSAEELSDLLTQRTSPASAARAAAAAADNVQQGEAK